MFTIRWPNPQQRKIIAGNIVTIEDAKKHAQLIANLRNTNVWIFGEDGIKEEISPLAMIEPVTD